MFLLVGNAPKAESSGGNTPDGQTRKGMKSCDKVSARKNGVLSSRASIDRQCGRSSAGRASPCHGEGRGFDSRRPLAVFDPGRDLRPCPFKDLVPGGVAEWLGSGLQSRLRGFESRLHLGATTSFKRLSAIGAAVARFPDTEEVTGSIPVSRTRQRPRNTTFRGLPRATADLRPGGTHRVGDMAQGPQHPGQPIVGDHSPHRAGHDDVPGRRLPRSTGDPAARMPSNSSPSAWAISRASTRGRRGSSIRVTSARMSGIVAPASSRSTRMSCRRST